MENLILVVAILFTLTILLQFSFVETCPLHLPSIDQHGQNKH